MCATRPMLAMDFLNPIGFLDPRAEFARAAGSNSRATRRNSQGTLIEVQANYLRWNYNQNNPVPQGLLIEEASTNAVFNSRSEGTGGTALNIGNMPTNHSCVGPSGGVLNGITILRSPLLPDATLNGMFGAVYTISGTATAQAIILLSPQGTAPTASSGQNWNFAAHYAWLGGGNLAGFASMNHSIIAQGGTAVANQDIKGLLALNAPPIRASANILTDAGTISAPSRLRLQIEAGQTVDAQIWCGPAQLEQKQFATSQILNPTGSLGAVSDRAVETLTAVLANFGPSNIRVEGTVFITVLFGVQASTPQTLFELSDNSANNRYLVRRLADRRIQLTVVAGGNAQEIISSGSITVPDSGRAIVGISWFNGRYSLIVNGTETVALGQALPNPITHLHLGTNRTGGESLNGHLQRVAVYPRLMSALERVMLGA